MITTPVNYNGEGIIVNRDGDVCRVDDPEIAAFIVNAVNEYEELKEIANNNYANYDKAKSQLEDLKNALRSILEVVDGTMTIEPTRCETSTMEIEADKRCKSARAILAKVSA